MEKRCLSASYTDKILETRRAVRVITKKKKQVIDADFLLSRGGVMSSAIRVASPYFCHLLCFSHGRPVPPALADDNGAHPRQPHEGGNNAIDDFTSLGAHARALGEFETKTTVDDTKSDGKTTKPNVCVRPDRATLGLDEEKVVEPSESGLEKEKGEED